MGTNQNDKSWFDFKARQQTHSRAISLLSQRPSRAIRQARWGRFFGSIPKYLLCTYVQRWGLDMHINPFDSLSTWLGLLLHSKDLELRNSLTIVFLVSYLIFLQLLRPTFLKCHFNLLISNSITVAILSYANRITNIGSCHLKINVREFIVGPFKIHSDITSRKYSP